MFWNAKPQSAHQDETQALADFDNLLKKVDADEKELDKLENDVEKGFDEIDQDIRQVTKEVDGVVS